MHGWPGLTAISKMVRVCEPAETTTTKTAYYLLITAMEPFERVPSQMWLELERRSLRLSCNPSTNFHAYGQAVTPAPNPARRSPSRKQP